MAGQQCVLELRQDRVLVAEDALDDRPAFGDTAGRVPANLLFHRHRLPAGIEQVTKRVRTRHATTIPSRPGLDAPGHPPASTVPAVLQTPQTPRPVPRRVLTAASIVAGAVAFGAAVLAFAAGLAALTGPPDEPTGAGPTRTRPEVSVTGTFTRLTGTAIDGPSFPMPVTLEVARGGGTKASITNVTVGGKSSAVAWDGGRPLPLRGEGSLGMNGPTDVETTARGLAWKLDGRPRALNPGSYRLGATVAVGGAGIGTPKEGVVVEVAQGTTGVLSTNGGVTLMQPAGAVTLRGPGELFIEGKLDVVTNGATDPVGTIRFGPGPFELNIEPVASQAGMWRITHGVFRGELTTGT